MNAKHLATAVAIAVSSHGLFWRAECRAQTQPATQDGQPRTGRVVRAPHDYARWEKEVAAYEEADKANPPPKNAVLFVGSSTIRLWKTLAEDTQVNETARRLQIHEILAACGTVQPQDVTRRLYKEVLHADLEDPYLGLGPTLFASYPFKAEDARH